MAVERRPITDREQWLAWRKQVVTASQVGWLFDLHPEGSPLKLYSEKTGVEFDSKDNKFMRRGRWFESAVGDAVRELRPDWRIESNKDPHTGLPIAFYADTEAGIGATPDFFIADDPRGLGVLQAKTVTPSIFAKEWDAGRAVPEWITLQCAVEIMMTDAAFGAIAALTIEPAAECEIIPVERNRDAEASIRARIAQFWQDVAKGRDPDPNPHKDAAVVRAMYPRSREGSICDLTGNNRISEMLARRADLNARIKRDEALVESIETEIKFAMGEAEQVTGLPEWHITYRTVDRKAYSVPAGKIRPLRIYDRRAAMDAAQ
jgi:predicted phage-related endonuclease